MTTTARYLLPSDSSIAPAPVSPAFGALWQVVSSGTRCAMATAAANTSDASRTLAEAVAGPAYASNPYQFVGPALAAGLVPTRVKITARTSTGTTGTTTQLAGRVAIRHADGSVTELWSGRGGIVNTSLFTQTARQIDQTLAGAPTTLAGDRLVVEVGIYIDNATSASSGGTIRLGDPTAQTDLAVGQTTAGRPWVEFTFEQAPSPPTALTQTAATPDSVTIEWTAPAVAPDSYEIRIDGGSPIDVGPGTSTTIPGLSPDTSYDVEVRSVNAYGASAWAGPLAVATIPEPPPPVSEGYYRATVEVGAHTWTAERGDPPGLGVALPLSFGWAIPDDALGYPAQPETATASLILVTATAADLDDVDIDTPMRIRVWTSIDPAARPFATFTGRVADYEAAPHDRGIAWRILGADYTVDLTARSVGSAEWPTETGDARAARIMAENGQTGWSTDPIGNTFEPRTGQAVSALAALVDTLTSAARYAGDEYDAPGRVILTAAVDADGRLETTPYVGHFTAAETNHIDTIDGSWVHRDSTWRRTRTMDGTWVHVEHPGGPTVYGKVTGPARPRIAVDVYDTDALADLVLASVPGYQWLSGSTLRLDLGADGVPAGYAVDWFWRDPDSPPVPWAGRLVVVEDINTLPGLFTRYAGMLAAARLVLEPGGRLGVDFRLRPDVPAHSTVTPRWLDEPPAATWLDEPAGATWFDLRTIDRLDYP